MDSPYDPLKDYVYKGKQITLYHTSECGEMEVVVHINNDFFKLAPNLGVGMSLAENFIDRSSKCLIQS